MFPMHYLFPFLLTLLFFLVPFLLCPYCTVLPSFLSKIILRHPLFNFPLLSFIMTLTYISSIRSSFAPDSHRILYHQLHNKFQQPHFQICNHGDKAILLNNAVTYKLNNVSNNKCLNGSQQHKMNSIKMTGLSGFHKKQATSELGLCRSHACILANDWVLLCILHILNKLQYFARFISQKNKPYIKLLFWLPVKQPY